MADHKFLVELCSGSDAKLWACLSEAFLAECLRSHGINPLPARLKGPDFLILKDDKKIWIEVICPEPKGIPRDWLKRPSGTHCVKFPYQAISLRWTSALKEKAEKLLGTADGRLEGYIAKGIVGPTDAYVIAINGCQLHDCGFSGVNGISTFPFAVEIAFAIGPQQIHIDTETFNQVGRGYQHRPIIINSNGSPVPADSFLNPRFNPISAIWAVDIDGTSAIGNREPMVVVHNPNATNPIPIGFLPAELEYVATRINDEQLELEIRGGQLSKGGY